MVPVGQALSPSAMRNGGSGGILRALMA